LVDDFLAAHSHFIASSSLNSLVDEATSLQPGVRVLQVGSKKGSSLPGVTEDEQFAPITRSVFGRILVCGRELLVQRRRDDCGSGVASAFEQANEVWGAPPTFDAP
jgi:hypothetical protein